TGRRDAGVVSGASIAPYDFCWRGALASPSLILLFNSLEARNTSTLRGRIGTSSPVLGLRPTRGPFDRIEKLRKEEIFTDSPRVRAATISLRTSSRRSADSFRERPTS